MCLSNPLPHPPVHSHLPIDLSSPFSASKFPSFIVKAPALINLKTREIRHYVPKRAAALLLLSEQFQVRYLDFLLILRCQSKVSSLQFKLIKPIESLLGCVLIWDYIRMQLEIVCIHENGTLSYS